MSHSVHLCALEPMALSLSLFLLSSLYLDEHQRPDFSICDGHHDKRGNKRDDAIRMGKYTVCLKRIAGGSGPGWKRLLANRRKRPVEATLALHVLSPRPLFAHLGKACLVADNLLALANGL